MTTTFYIPVKNFSGDRVVLPAEEARHAAQVLRHRAGDEIVGVDGAGGWYRIELTEVDRKRVEGRVVEARRDVGESSLRLTLALGLLKNQKRFEIFVEKACELGVSRIVPLQTERTEKSGFRRERLESILVAAMKQSGRSRLTVVDGVTSFDDLLHSKEQKTKLLCHEGAGPDKNLLDYFDLTSMRADYSEGILVVIGPEGGFSEEEVERAAERGFQIVSLGRRRLRAETAAIAACAGIMLVQEGC